MSILARGCGCSSSGRGSSLGLASRTCTAGGRAAAGPSTRPHSTSPSRKWPSRRILGQLSGRVREVEVGRKEKEGKGIARRRRRKGAREESKG